MPTQRMPRLITGGPCDFVPFVMLHLKFLLKITCVWWAIMQNRWRGKLAPVAQLVDRPLMGAEGRGFKFLRWCYCLVKNCTGCSSSGTQINFTEIDRSPFLAKICQKRNHPCNLMLKWTASSDFGTYSLCEQRRFRRACASAQSRQNLRCSLI